MKALTIALAMFFLMVSGAMAQTPCTSSIVVLDREPDNAVPVTANNWVVLTMPYSFHIADQTKITTSFFKEAGGCFVYGHPLKSGNNGVNLGNIAQDGDTATAFAVACAPEWGQSGGIYRLSMSQDCSNLPTTLPILLK